MAAGTEEGTQMKQVLAEPWDVIICPNDHPCFLALREICAGELMGGEAFRAIGKQEPIVSGRLVSWAVCAECGRPVFIWVSSIAGYWRIRTLRGKQGRSELPPFLEPSSDTMDEPDQVKMDGR